MINIQVTKACHGMGKSTHLLFITNKPTGRIGNYENILKLFMYFYPLFTISPISSTSKYFDTFAQWQAQDVLGTFPVQS